MAIAEKAATERTPRTPQELLPIASLLGAIYLLVSLGVVFTGLPWLWANVLHVNDYLNEFLSAALLFVATAAAAAGFIYLGIRLEKNPPHGFRAGTFFLSLCLLAIFWITMKVGAGLAAASLEFGVGVGVMAMVAVGLVYLVWWFFHKPGFLRWLMKVEDQGWFHARGYKPNQGLRVRRGTIIGILIIGFSGIFTLVTGNMLRSNYNDNNWALDVPYSEPVLGALAANKDGKVEITKVLPDSPAARGGLQPKDVIVEIEKKALPADARLPDYIATKYPHQRLNFKVNRQVKNETKSEEIPVTLGASMVPILYNVQLTVPLILSVLLVWLAWRVVHLPVFADFLIATEAEMNKVSWTTRKRLVQDTIVVLVTVILMAVFLFVVDILWIKALSFVQVLKVDIRAEQQRQQEKSQW